MGDAAARADADAPKRPEITAADAPAAATADDGTDGSVAPAVKFKSRRRPQKARRRGHAGDEPGYGASDEEEDERAGADVAMLREARRLRDQARRLHLAAAPRARADVDDAADTAAGADDAAAGGLRSNFAVESSGYDAQRNMEQFVEERMAAKYGSRVAEGRPGKAVVAGSDDEEEEVCGEAARRKRPRVSSDDAEAGLYSVPDHMRVPARQQYDPSEGLPAAGMEEVDIGAVARRRNAEMTALAQARLEAERADGARGGGGGAEAVFVGNVSANFTQHRRDWIQNRIQEEKLGKRPGPSQPGQAPDGGGAGGDGGASAGGSRQQSDQSSADKWRQRPAALASDRTLSERFRKRWRK
jgi:hypothetical protein